MSHRVLFLPLGALCLLAAIVGWRMGSIPSETDLITAYAARYVSEAPAGAALTDCAATNHPQADVRMIVACHHPGGQRFTYLVGPRGQLVRRDGPAT